jgi:hypothetical protein
MPELLVDFITSLDGCASGEGWPGFWGLEGPEYLSWLGEQPDATYLMGANTYRLMSGFAAGEVPDGQEEFRPEELDGRILLVEYRPRVLEHPPLVAPA